MQGKTIIVASSNEHKIKEIAEIFNGYSVIGCKQLGFNGEIEETGETFFDNALIKAKTVAKALNKIVLADDSGLCVDALGGAPGVYSARYAGDGESESNIDKLLKELKGQKNRRAKFVCCMVMCNGKGDKICTTKGETLGEILEERRGKCGFDYDPIFYSYDLKKSFGEATESEKNSVSHRARAIKNLLEQMKQFDL